MNMNLYNGRGQRDDRERGGDMTKVVNKLKKIRLMRSAEMNVHLSLSAVAREIDYSRTNLFYFETRTDRIPTAEMLARLADFYGVEPGALIGWNEDIVTEETEQ
jgi:transcriptional regulator with XRE-family HTH domain